MGKGSYLGGSTILGSGGSDWAFNPKRRTKPKSERRKKRNAATKICKKTHTQTKQSKSQKLEPRPSTLIKKTRNPEAGASKKATEGNAKVCSDKKLRRPTVKEIELKFLRQVIRSKLSKAPLPKFPKKYRAILSRIVSKKGGINSWMITHQKYTDIYREVRRERLKSSQSGKQFKEQESSKSACQRRGELINSAAPSQIKKKPVKKKRAKRLSFSPKLAQWNYE